MLTENDVLELNQQFQSQAPKEILRHAFAQSNNIALSFSGAEDVVLVDMAVKLNKNVRIFTLDTGRLHGETYRFLDKVRQHYQINL